ncbi:proton-conducting transporter transmembrane domain-containing protein [Nocardia vaccinii]|uniref:proton-conducting transporter transmembrane domain-containing protein n=1 Tax=Nocardia vaccinii TaxID=1822 RepID=UPI0008311EA4|nr:proton-conducting transporter membrane subunit [Nocardia vaccinii]
MTALILVAILAPVAAAVTSMLAGWRRSTAVSAPLSGVTILICAAVLIARLDRREYVLAGGLLRVDGVSVTMLTVIGVVGTLATLAGIGYINAELAHAHTDARAARGYAALVPTFLATMVIAVCANNIGVTWVAIEATTLATAFLVGHRRTRAALEATWKYVIICSVGIVVAFLGTIVLYFGARHAGAATEQALNLDVLLARAPHLNPDVTRLAGGLLLIGYGAKAGLVPFHTWLADAHSQAPAPVSALMSGVLLAVAFSVVLRITPIIDAAVGPGYLQTGLLIIGLLTMTVAALLLTVTRDVKRMLAYSSMENMGLIAVAAAGGTRLAIAALLLHVVAHGIGKTVLFISTGPLQAAHDSTALDALAGVAARSRLLGTTITVGTAVLLGLPPFAMFASELAIARSLSQAHLAWALAVALMPITVAFAALVRNTSHMLLSSPPAGAPAISVPATTTLALFAGVVVAVVLGMTAGPFTDLFTTAAVQVIHR